MALRRLLTTLPPEPRTGLALALVLIALAWLPFGEVNAFRHPIVPVDAAEVETIPLRTFDFLGEIAPIAAAASGVLASIANLGVVANNPYLYSPPWYGYRPSPVYAPGYGYGFPYVYGRNAVAERLDL